ncbi:hypothetical protein HMPREF0298_1700 [Corynebacterium lipophiloflavum DSM 44291]|uniref:Uncharacterized protein n=1 Tax=Corynebacterium lipophiloflavum (strain ATCC 700352 / DSM 44291 / CCUG 37336 / JCM 10383 / DMMZ 1944) TaxID=525263 RepID=C0XTD0_CORLD|nr:hypothetical protein HMPREF0298_1700 [Corynebacterium lipophiloflavum DSM 44291]
MQTNARRKILNRNHIPKPLNRHNAPLKRNSDEKTYNPHPIEQTTKKKHHTTKQHNTKTQPGQA